MVPAAIIAIKRDGGEHSATEIREMIDGFTSGQVADCQMAAWAMAIVCRGMSATETTALTQAMLSSGACLPRVSDRPRVDKHSTGGLGDSPSLVLAPLLACFDLEVPMLSGRCLGITGGTLDKLESIPGFRCNLESQEISRQLAAIGCVITGTTPDIAPADRQLYALRDVTGTVESIPLITASIMSKKMAETLNALVLDVKFGSAAFMQTLDQARGLARSLSEIGRSAGLTTRVLLTDMNQPLGRMVGNACEVNEAIELLHGQVDNALGTVTLRLCSELLVAASKASDTTEAEQALKQELASGRPLARFEQMVQWQGGQYRDRLRVARSTTLTSAASGFVHKINGRLLGQAIIELGGGRKQLGQSINHSVGLQMHVRLGDRVERGQPLVDVFAEPSAALASACHLVSQSISISAEVPPEFPLVIAD